MKATDDHDFHGFKKHSLSEEFQLERKQCKFPRKSEMPFARKENDKQADRRFSDVVRLVSETISRSNQSVSKASVSTFLYMIRNDSMNRRLFSLNSFARVKAHIDEIAWYFGNEPCDVAAEMKKQISIVEKDLVAYLLILTSGGKGSSIYGSIYDDALADISDPFVTWPFSAFAFSSWIGNIAGVA
jgi:hypothetical protein